MIKLPEFVSLPRTPLRDTSSYNFASYNRGRCEICEASLHWFLDSLHDIRISSDSVINLELGRNRADRNHTTRIAGLGIDAMRPRLRR